MMSRNKSHKLPRATSLMAGFVVLTLLALAAVRVSAAEEEEQQQLEARPPAGGLIKNGSESSGGLEESPLSQENLTKVTEDDERRDKESLLVQPAQEEGTNSKGEANHTRHQSSLIGMLLSPIRATFARAKRMLGARLGGARDLVVSGFDELQTRTFKVFMMAYNKSYGPEELPRRMALFFERRKLIEQSVREFARGATTFVMRENSFTDWDQDELKHLAGVSPPLSLDDMTDEEREATLASESAASQQQQLEHKILPSLDDGSEELTIEWQSQDDSMTQDDQRQLSISPSVSRNFVFKSDDSLENNMTVKAVERIPAQKDWRTSGCVARPINQMKCGACYAIATVGVVESMRCINRVASSPILSPQQVVDCSRAYKNFGCDGGWPTRVLKYLQDTRVLARESCYPFVRRANTCRLRQVQQATSCTVSASPTDGAQIQYKVLNNERDILYHVAKTGPVVTVMRATDSFLYYGKGIFDDPKCTRKRDDVDHAISIVGYGRENNIDYWIIKNSWGTTDWGEGGYGKFKRGTNACSIGHWGWVITG